jgi:hypothetical protein
MSDNGERGRTGYHDAEDLADDPLPG